MSTEERLNYFAEKYGLQVSDGKRIYHVPLNKRIYGYERCTPWFLYFEKFLCNDTSWKEMLVKLFKYLQEKHPKTKDELLEYRTDWTRAAIFRTEKTTTNSVLVDENLWMSHNFTGSHYVWIIQDLLKFFYPNLDNYTFTIRVPSLNEPEEIKQYFKNDIIEKFKAFLREKGKNVNSISTIIKNIEKVNAILQEMNIATNDFFLIDDLVIFKCTKARVFEYLRKRQMMNDDQIGIANHSLNYLYNCKKIK